MESILLESYDSNVSDDTTDLSFTLRHSVSPHTTRLVEARQTCCRYVADVDAKLLLQADALSERVFRLRIELGTVEAYEKSAQASLKESGRRYDQRAVVLDYVPLEVQTSLTGTPPEVEHCACVYVNQM